MNNNKVYKPITKESSKGTDENSREQIAAAYLSKISNKVGRTRSHAEYESIISSQREIIAVRDARIKELTTEIEHYQNKNIFRRLRLFKLPDEKRKAPGIKKERW